MANLNESQHNFITINALEMNLPAAEFGHLRYEQGRGVVKIEEADCELCEAWGLNDGRWHPVPKEK